MKIENKLLLLSLMCAFSLGTMCSIAVPATAASVDQKRATGSNMVIYPKTQQKLEEILDQLEGDLTRK